MKMFKKKNKPKFTKLTSVKDVKAKVREFILDSQIPNPHEIAEVLGCVPISDDVAEREEEESDKRVEQVAFLIPLLYGYSTLFAESFIKDAHVTASEEFTPEMAKMVAGITRATQHVLEDAMAHFLTGAVSQLVDLELLVVNTKEKK